MLKYFFIVSFLVLNIIKQAKAQSQSQKLLILNDIHYDPNITGSTHWGNYTDFGIKG